uniref:uncharacterized protein LOC108950204 isoform X2 n=1 Tax=Ciona intestinalis TaxID=7719 RepID=UPI000180BC11|nr:uncharacterized protein LOC108950204 isoform X2 [Ciona intestinalis]|eukprot:XP_018670790.1 uncharacterized protein LOC108950204 isoform X2 [Ciona intestinalis]
MKVAIIVVLIAVVGCANARSLIRDDLEEMQNMLMDRLRAEGLNVGEDEDEMPHELHNLFDSWSISPQNKDETDYVGQQGSTDTKPWKPNGG